MDVHHILWECPATLTFRFNCFKKLYVEETNRIMGAEYKYQIKPNELSEFLKKLEELDFNWLIEANQASLPQAMLSEAPPLTCKPS